MNRKELAAKVAEKAEVPAGHAETVVSATFDAIGESLASGEKVTVQGFGAFEVTERAARTARNPATGEDVQVPASKAPKFKPGKALKEQVNS